MFHCQWDKEVPVVSRILLPLRLHLKKAQMYLPYIVVKHRWASLWRRCGEFCELQPLDHQKRCIFENWAPSNNLKMIRIFIEKSSLAMRLISGWKAWSINKICIIDQTAIHTYSMSHHCIPKKWRFGAVYGPAASLGRTSSVLIKTGTSLWMGIATVQWYPNISGTNWMISTWRTSGSNRTAPIFCRTLIEKPFTFF